MTSVSPLRLAIALAAALVSSLFAGALVAVLLSPATWAQAAGFYFARWPFWLLLYIAIFLLLLLKQKVER